MILINVRKRVLTTGAVNPHVSDHSLTYTILRTSLQVPRSQKITFRSLKHYYTGAFLNDLDMVPFRTVMNVFYDIDDKLTAFESLFHTIINQHAPLKQAHVRGGQVPYLTDEWRKGIRHQNHLWKVFSRNKTDVNYSLYKLQKNKCTSLRRKSIISYFRKKSLA